MERYSIFKRRSYVQKLTVETTMEKKRR